MVEQAARTSWAPFSLLLLVVFFPSPGTGEEVEAVAPSADAFIHQGKPNHNFGSRQVIEIRSKRRKNRRGLVRFDLAGAFARETAIKTAILHLFKESAGGGRRHSAHRVLGEGDWREGGVTWNRRSSALPWTHAGGDFQPDPLDTKTVPHPSGARVSWVIRADDVVDNVPQQWLDRPGRNHGLLIKDEEEESQVGKRVRYFAREAQNGDDEDETQGDPPSEAQGPQLEVRFLRNLNLLEAIPGISEITWRWAFPSGSSAENYDGVLFVKKEGSEEEIFFHPADGTVYEPDEDLANGESVAIHTASFGRRRATEENGVDNVVLPGTAYTYKAFTHDANPIPGAASPDPPHYALGVSRNVATLAGGGPNKKWSYQTGGMTLSAPGLAGGAVVVTGDVNGRLHAMDALSGRRRYRPGGQVGMTDGAIQSRPTVIPAGLTSHPCGCDVAYVGAADGRVYAFNATSGEEFWRSNELGSSLVGSPGVQLKRFSPSLPYDFDLVIVGTHNFSDTTGNSIVGVDGNSGATVWTFQPGNLDAINSAPVLDFLNNVAWFTSRAGAVGDQPSLWKLETVNGDLLESVILTSVSNPDVDGSPVLNVGGSFLYALTLGGDLVAVDTSSLEVRSTDLGQVSGVGFPLPLPREDNDEVYFSTASSPPASGGIHKRVFNRASRQFIDHAFAELDPGGWDNTDIPNPSTPVLAPITTFPPTGFSLYVGSAAGKIHKIDPGTGAEAAERTLNPEATIGELSFDTLQDQLYAGASDGRVYAIDLF